MVTIPWGNICSGCLGSLSLQKHNNLIDFLSGHVSLPNPFNSFASSMCTNLEISSIEAQSTFEDWPHSSFD